MRNSEPPVFTTVDDWLEHLNKDGEVYKSSRSMVAQTPTSLADLQEGLPEAKAGNAFAIRRFTAYSKFHGLHFVTRLQGTL